MIRRIGLAIGVAAVLAAGGCNGPQVLSGSPPPVARDAFAYKPIACERSAPVAAAPTFQPPRLDLAPPEPVLPPADPAWMVAGATRPWRWIVVHHSASDKGSAAAFDEYHRNGRHWDELGYHFVIGNGTGSGDGRVEVGSRWPKQKYGAHCRVGNNEEYNDFGIGICLVGNFDKQRPTEAQMAGLARLVAFLAARYKVDDAHLIGHGMVGDTRCPGRLFPFDDLRSRLRATREARLPLAMAR